MIWIVLNSDGNMKKKFLTGGALCALFISGVSVSMDAESIKDERVLQL